MKNHLVLSVCMITYNQEAFIAQAIEGILRQKCNFSFELVIGEDFSSDSTRTICEEYAKNNNIVKLLQSNENLGMMSNFSRTIDNCNGKYIAICEGDDYWTDPYKLQKQVDFLEANPDFGLVHTEFDTLYVNDNFIMTSTHKKLGIPLSGSCSLEYWNAFGKSLATIKTLTVCIRKSYLTDYFEFANKHINDWMVGDFPLFFFISLKSKIGYISESTAVYRTVSSGSASSVKKNSEFFFRIKQSYVRLRYFFLENQIQDKKKYKQAYNRDFTLLLKHFIIANNKTEFMNELKNNRKYISKSGIILIGENLPFLLFNYFSVTYFNFATRLTYLLFYVRRPIFLYLTVKRKIIK